MKLKKLVIGVLLCSLCIQAFSSCDSTIPDNPKEAPIESKEVSNVVLFNNGTMEIDGTFADVLKMVNSRQLYDEKLWSRFVTQFRSNVDGKENAWRGEFWGKMMEGAVITYNATKDERLYGILTTTVKDLLTTQQENGSISSYGDMSKGNSNEFNGWDMWCRTWTMTGLVYYHSICQDADLKQQIITSLEEQLDFITTHVGDGEGKRNINDCASEWGGLNASDVLEVVCKIYRLTGKQSYLDFATHIVENGGFKNGNLIESAIENKTLPYQWGVPKAGELCLFFDGVLEYYHITGEEKYKTAAVNFWYGIHESDLTIVGGGGTKGEEFEHSAVEQCDPTKTGAMQEHCVTAHWMNFSKDIYQVTKDPAVIDSLERTIYNAVLGSVDNEEKYDHAFTSYNALIYTVRPTSAAGGLQMNKPYPWAYGCCISLGSITTGLIPQLQYAMNEEGLYANLFLPGTISGTLNSGNEISILTETTYPKGNKISMTISPNQEETFALRLRIPGWSKNTIVKVNGQQQKGVTAGEYYTIERAWRTGDKVELVLDMQLVAVYGSEECSNPNGKNNVALVRGPITFARDARLDGGEILETVTLALNKDGSMKYTLSDTAAFENIVEVEVELADGKKIHLVNYGHAGKTYTSESMYTVYMPTTDYWKTSFTGEAGVILLNDYYKKLAVEGTDDGYLHIGEAVSNYSDLSAYKVQFLQQEGGYYYIKQIETGMYLTVVPGATGQYFCYLDYTGEEDQQFYLKPASLFTYKIISKTGYLVSANTETTPIHLYSDCSSAKQFWILQS